MAASRVERRPCGWATPACPTSVIFICLTDPYGGIVAWPGPDAACCGGAALGPASSDASAPTYPLLTVLVVWQGFPFVAFSVLAVLTTRPP